MFEELIKEIERAGTNYVLSRKVIEFIKAYEPQWLDAPIEEGWWWLKDEDGFVDAKLITSNAVGFWVDEGVGENYRIERYNGKWIRAIVPK